MIATQLVLKSGVTTVFAGDVINISKRDAYSVDYDDNKLVLYHIFEPFKTTDIEFKHGRLSYSIEHNLKNIAAEIRKDDCDFKVGDVIQLKNDNSQVFNIINIDGDVIDLFDATHKQYNHYTKEYISEYFDIVKYANITVLDIMHYLSKYAFVYISTSLIHLTFGNDLSQSVLWSKDVYLHNQSDVTIRHLYGILKYIKTL